MDLESWAAELKLIPEHYKVENSWWLKARLREREKRRRGRDN